MVCNVNLGKRAITVITNDLSVKDNDHVAVSLYHLVHLWELVVKVCF